MPPFDPSRPVAFCPVTGKVCHPSRRVAVENMNRARKVQDMRGRDRRVCGKLMVYQCEFCSLWHAGNHDPENTKRKRAKQGRPRHEDYGEDAA